MHIALISNSIEVIVFLHQVLKEQM